MSENTLNDRIFISKGTILGFIVFIFTLAIYTILEVSKIKLFSDRITIAIMGSAIIFMLLGFIIDQLNYRGFRFWAFGAMISFLGVFVFFSPILLYGMSIDDTNIWLGLIIAGIALIVFGFTVDAFDLNNKLAKLLINLWDEIKTYQWKKIPIRIVKLMAVLLGGVVAYILLGFKQIRRITRNFILGTYHFVKTSIIKTFSVLLDVPEMIFKTLKVFYSFSYFLLIPSIIILVLNYGYDSNSFVSYVAILIGIVILFLIGLNISNEEKLRNISSTVSSVSWKALQVVSSGLQSAQARFGRFKCQSCDQILEIGQTKCAVCLTDVKSCTICKLPIKSDQKVTECSFCQYPSHSNHWDQWIRMGRNCPICSKS